VSGGSYEYLFVKDADEILGYSAKTNLRAMADRLTEIGDADDAAGETEDIIAMIAQFERRVAVRLRRLSGVWRAVEWMDSNDSGIEEVRAALNEYRGDKEP
jgi:phosphoglycolate phosphatase-like HAD superfamily hydrolase